jgi:hypothetical protein
LHKDSQVARCNVLVSWIVRAVAIQAELKAAKLLYCIARGVPDLALNPLCLCFQVETADIDVEFGLVSADRCEANLGGWRWWESLDTFNSDSILADFCL